MSPEAVQRKTHRRLLDIPSAAFQAGYSPRHFRKIIEEDHIPVRRIGQKYYITAQDLETWKSTRGEARLDACLQQLDRWLKDDLRTPAPTPAPVADFDDED